MTYYLKMCSFKGAYFYHCVDCKYQLDAIGCKAIRKSLQGKIVYLKVCDIVADMVLDDFLGRKK